MVLIPGPYWYAYRQVKLVLFPQASSSSSASWQLWLKQKTSVKSDDTGHCAQMKSVATSTTPEKTSSATPTEIL